MQQSDIKHMEPLLWREGGVGSTDHREACQVLNRVVASSGEPHLLGERPSVQGSNRRWGAHRELRATAGCKLVSTRIFKNLSNWDDVPGMSSWILNLEVSFLLTHHLLQKAFPRDDPSKCNLDPRRKPPLHLSRAWRIM